MRLNDATIAILSLYSQENWVTPALESYPLTVDYDQPLRELMAICTTYSLDFAMSVPEPERVSPLSPSIKVVPLRIGLLVYEHEAQSALSEAGLRPATLTELLTFTAYYPDLCASFPVAALGTTTISSPQRPAKAPFIRREAAGRTLQLHSLGRLWDTNFRFLGVHE